MKFKLFSKLASLEGLELWMLIGAAALFLGLLILAIRSRRKDVQKGINISAKKQSTARVLVYGALSLTLSFVLSYFKLFSMPFGGSITLFSMLPLVAYASWFGPIAGFTAAFAYALLQIIQGAWIVHWLQFILDYFVAFTILGVSAFFPKKLPLGMAIAGFLRCAVSTVSGAVFFADSGLDYGIANPWVYSIAYNGLTIGVDTVLCIIIALVPNVYKAIDRAFSGK